MTDTDLLNRLGDPLAAIEGVARHGSLTAFVAAEHPELLGDDEREILVRAEHLRLVNVWAGLGTALYKVERLNSEPPAWRLTGAIGTALATAGNVAEWRQLKAKLLAATGEVPELVEVAPGQKMPAARVSKALLHAAVPVDVGDDATDAGRCRSIIEAMLDHIGGKPRTFETHETANAGGRFALHLGTQEFSILVPYLLELDARTLWVHGESLRQFARLRLADPVNRNEVGPLLTSVDARSDRPHVGGRRASLWATPWPW